MPKYLVTVTIAIDVPEEWDNDNDVDEWIAEAIAFQISEDYEIDSYTKEGSR